MRQTGMYGPRDVRGEDCTEPRFLPEPIDRVLSSKIDPGRAFDLTLPLDRRAEAYGAMDERRAVKVLLQPRWSAES